jgi:hypothetical protein
MFPTKVKMPAVDLSVSHRLLNEKMKAFNEDLKRKDLERYNTWKELNDASIANGQPPIAPFKSIYKSECFKSTYLDTAKIILNMIRTHINNQRNLLLEYDKFCVTRKEIGDRRGLSNMTVQRHLDFLEKHNIIWRKFRGYSHPQEIRLNPEYLAAKIDAESSVYFVEKYQFLGSKTVEDVLMGRTPWRPFGGFFHWPIVTSCENKDDCLNLLQNKKQQQSGVFSENGFFNFCLNTESDAINPSPLPPSLAETKQIPIESKQFDDSDYFDRERKQNQRNTFDSYVRLLVRSFINILYPGYTLHPEEEQELKRLFGNMLRYDDGALMDVRLMGRKYTEFVTRFFKVYHWKFRGPNRYLPRPSAYLNPNNPNGFKNTEAWFIEDRKKQQENPDWNKNTKLLVELVRKYQADPNLKNYMDGKKELEKKQTPALMELYNMVVIGEKELSQETIQATWRGQSKTSNQLKSK